MNSAFFRDIILRRQTRLNRTHKNGRKPIPAKIRGVSTGSLNSILEEELDSMDFQAPAPTTRAQRRCALSSIPRELKTALEDISEEASPLKFFDMPLPPLPMSLSRSRSSHKSPPLLSSSLPSSPDSHKAALPLTPSSSVEELPLPSPPMKLKRLATVKPLVINKLRRPAVQRPEDSDSEDSDSEWYTREFSSLLSVDSSSQPMPLPAAHRDSIFVAPSDSPFSPLSPPLPGRRQRKFSGANNHPPPVPPIPPQFRSAKCNKPLFITAPRRPPRMSIPDDACSAFSLSMHTDDIVEAERIYLSMYSPESTRMMVRKDLDEDVEFPGEFDVQVDSPMMLPFSFPASPIDPEVDIVNGLEQLCRQRESVVPVSPLAALGVQFLLEESDYGRQIGLGPDVVTPQISFTSPPPSPTTQVSCAPLSPPPAVAMPSTIPPPRPRRCSTISNLSSISFPPSPSIPCHDLPAPECAPPDDDFDERKLGLKSKWSNSSISSLHEGHTSSPKFPSASRLKMYFQGQHKRSANNSTLSNLASPKSSRSSSPAKGKKKPKKETKKGKGGSDMPERDVLVIGYNDSPSPRSFPYSPFSPPTSPRSSYDRTTLNSSPRHSPNMLDLPPTLPVQSLSSRYHGHIRWPSQGSAISDSGSDSSYISVASHLSNSSGTGMRRKPIPLVIFGKNGA